MLLTPTVTELSKCTEGHFRIFVSPAAKYCLNRCPCCFHRIRLAHRLLPTATFNFALLSCAVSCFIQFRSPARKIDTETAVLSFSFVFRFGEISPVASVQPRPLPVQR